MIQLYYQTFLALDWSYQWLPSLISGFYDFHHCISKNGKSFWGGIESSYLIYCSWCVWDDNLSAGIIRKCCLSDTFYNLKNNYSVLLPNLSFLLVHHFSRPPRNQALYSHGTEDTSRYSHELRPNLSRTFSRISKLPYSCSYFIYCSYLFQNILFVNLYYCYFYYGLRLVRVFKPLYTNRCNL